jgi:hypothetical protein
MSSEGRLRRHDERTGRHAFSRRGSRRRSRPPQEQREPWAPVGRIDFSRLDVNARVIGAASLVLFLALELPWYTTAPTARAGGFTGSANAMIAGGWRWLLWIGCLSVAGYVFLEAVTSFRPPKWLRREETLVAVTGLNVLLVLIGVLVDTPLPPPGGRAAAAQPVGISWGGWISLVAALAALAASLVALRERTPARARDLPVNEAIAYVEPPAELSLHVQVIEPEPPPRRPLHARASETDRPPERPRHARVSERDAAMLRQALLEASDLPALDAPVPAHAARAHRPAADPSWVPRPESRESLEVPEPGGNPPSGWMPPLPPPPPPL